MGNRKTKFLVLLIFFCIIQRVYAISLNDILNNKSIWIKFNRITNEPDYCLSINKLSDQEYFILYTTKGIEYTGDIYGIAKIYDDNKLIFQKNSYDCYYIYFDENGDSVYVLWNHEIPDERYYDVKLVYIQKLFDIYSLNNEEKIKNEEEQINKIISNYLNNCSN